ncbi:MAG: carboxypeptidase regulatory-like domain-containing protein, partial [Gemmatimonadota bacterium]|nr:carboxypeptidase regulatory-like domain-containing protein [Gemmatimonadota bacterium]
MTTSRLARLLRSAVSIAVLFGAFSVLVAAQTTQTGIVQGRVTAADGQPLPNATVAIKQTDGSYPRAVRTDDRGEYRISFLTQGIYNVEFRLVGYRAGNVDSVRVRATEIARADIVLQLSTTNLATVTVTAKPNAIDKITTEFTSSLTVKERELLPTGRGANSLIAFTPGARPDGVFGGSTGQANLYQLDGVTMNQPGTGGSFLLPNVDWLEDIRVIGLGAGAEYGNFQGGLINMVTKSGTNTRQGAIRTFYETRALGATNVNAFENGSELDNRSEINAELRGPLRKDRLYYYVSGQESFLNTRVVDFRNGGGGVVAFLPASAAEHGQKYYGKLTWLASPRDNINLSLGLDALYREHVGLNGYDA